jgi:ABC-2 type transport system permease protein
MMLKLLKYDFRKVRTWILCYGSIGILVNLIFAISIVIGANGDGNNDFLDNVTGITLALSIMFLISIPLAILFMSVNLYISDYKKKQGYMTLLTPNNSAMILGSKIIMSLIMLIVGAVVIIGFVLFHLWMYTLSYPDSNLLSHIISSLFDSLKGNVLSLIFMVIDYIFEWTVTILTMYLSITIASIITKKGKAGTFVAIVIWLVLIFLITQISYIGKLIFGDSVGINVGFYNNFEFSLNIISAPIIFGMCVNVVLSVLIFVIVSYLNEKKISF